MEGGRSTAMGNAPRRRVSPRVFDPSVFRFSDSGSRLKISGEEGIMPRYILLDELHLAVSVPRELPESTISVIHWHLNSLSFKAAIRNAIRSVFQHHPQLRKVRVRVTR
jgi:hypothetical protein